MLQLVRPFKFKPRCFFYTGVLFFDFFKRLVHPVSSRQKVVASILAHVLLGVSCQLLTNNALSATAKIKSSSGNTVLVDFDTLDRDNNKKTVELKGNVHVLFEQESLSCEHAIINYEKETLDVFGHFSLASPQSYVEGDEAHINYKLNTGIISNGYIQSGQILLEGRIIEKLGRDKYEAKTAYFTTCTTCPPAWNFTGSKISAELGGYAHIKNPILGFAEFPVLWLPYLIVPLKSQRQSGLLVPSFSVYGDYKQTFQFKYFWAISDSQDLTTTLTTYKKGGEKLSLDYLFYLNQTSIGHLQAGTIQDRLFANSEQYSASGGDHPHFNRWFLTYDHFYELPEGFVQTAKLNLISDLLYPKDFASDMTGVGDPALENRLTLHRNSEKSHVSFDTDYYIDLLKQNVLSGNQGAVHRFPEIRYSVSETKIADSPLLFQLDTNYVNFARESLAYDKVTVVDSTRTIVTNPSATDNTAFNPSSGDIIRSGQRIDLQPKLSLPIRVGDYFDILPSLTYRHTQYYFNVNSISGDFDSAPTRQFLLGEISNRTQFSAIYNSEDNLTKYKHEIEPEIAFSTVPWFYHTRSSFFGEDATVPSFKKEEPIGDDDFRGTRGIQFDYHDRILSRNVITYTLNNKLIRKTITDNRASYKQIAQVKLSQSYDLSEANRERGEQKNLPWSDIALLTDLRLDYFETNTLLQYYPYHNVINTDSRVKFISARGNYLQLEFSQKYVITEDLSKATQEKPSQTIKFSGGMSSQFVDLKGSVEFSPESYSPILLKVRQWEAYFSIKPPGDCWGLKVAIQQTIGNAPTQTFEPAFNFNSEYKF